MRLPRSKGGVSPDLRAKYDRFVEALLMGLGSTQAAVFAGASSRAAANWGYKAKLDPYVRTRFADLREKLSKDEICSFAELALNVKSMAFDECAPDSTRIRASKLMADLMGHNAPVKQETTLNGGVLLLPVSDSMEQWESQAIAAQERLQQEVAQDADNSR